VFQELGKALTSSLQLDQVLRTIMEKIDEFLRPDNWSLLLLDEPKQELYFELAVGKASQALKDVRVKVGQGIAGWVAQHGEIVNCAGHLEGHAVLRQGGREDENGNALDRGDAGEIPR